MPDLPTPKTPEELSENLKKIGATQEQIENMVSKMEKLLEMKGQLAAAKKGIDDAQARAKVKFAPKSTLTVTFKADGSVMIADKLGTYTIPASGYAKVTELSSEMLCADFVVVVKTGKVNRMLNINATLCFDRTCAPDETGEAAFAE